MIEQFRDFNRFDVLSSKISMQRMNKWCELEDFCSQSLMFSYGQYNLPCNSRLVENSLVATSQLGKTGKVCQQLHIERELVFFTSPTISGNYTH